jgi:hypothetical protein
MLNFSGIRGRGPLTAVRIFVIHFRMIIRCVVLLLAFGLAFAQESPLDLPKEKQQALMETHLFPLLEEADQIVIYSLYPVRKKDLGKEIGVLELSTAFGFYEEAQVARLNAADKDVATFARIAETFEGYPVLGKMEIGKKEDRPKFLAEVRAKMTPWEDSEDCHDPRHGILIRKGTTILRFTICFECGNSSLRGAPDSAKDAVMVFNHFGGDFHKYLEAWMDSARLPRRPYSEHPVKPAK